jgi:hypothetical protein
MVPWWSLLLAFAAGVWVGVRLTRWAFTDDDEDGDILGWRWGRGPR